MSFKREGNDLSLLDKLRKRRITELLSEDIPEDEAKLLCNGRFTCTVCPSNPIFDTVNMLTVHRKGKKHLLNQEIHKVKIKELNNLIAIRRHHQYMKDGSTSIRVAKTNDKGLLTSCPYDPRVKKVKINKGERKPILDLDKESKSKILALHSVNTHDESVSPAVANVNVTRDSSLLREQCLSGPFKHTYQLKNIFQEKMEDPVRIIPYKSKFRKNHTTYLNTHSSSHASGVSSQTSSLNKKQNFNICSLPSSYGDILSLSSGKTSSQSVPFSVSETHFASKPSEFQHGPNYVQTVPVKSVSELLISSENNASKSILNPAFTANEALSTQKPSVFHCGQFSKQSIVIGAGFEAHTCLPFATLLPPPPPPIVSTESSTSTISNPSSVSDKTFARAEKVTDQRLISQKLKQLQGSGWKRDWDGKWIKDEYAEFDSDDEPPDIP